MHALKGMGAFAGGGALIRSKLNPPHFECQIAIFLNSGSKGGGVQRAPKVLFEEGVIFLFCFLGDGVLSNPVHHTP